MDSAIAGLIIVTLLLVGMLTLAQNYLAVQDEIQASWRTMQVRMEERSQTRLGSLQAEAISGDEVEIVLGSEGSAKLADFAQWDVIVQYAGESAWFADWYPYTSTTVPGNNQWGVEGIYLDPEHTLPEAYDPGILNPGEYVRIQVRLFPSIAEGSTNLVTVATPNGIAASTVFTR
jgi:hypothetical protein